jgi:hypothetical protein
MLRGILHKGAKIILSFGAAAEVLTMRAIYIEKHGGGADIRRTHVSCGLEKIHELRDSPHTSPRAPFSG